MIWHTTWSGWLGSRDLLDDRQLAVKPVTEKTSMDLQIEWNRIATLRHRQIASGSDLSFSHVLLPLVQELLSGCNLKNVLDLGCGTGDLTKEVASLAAQVTGVDLSSESVAISRKTCADSTNVSFYVGTAEEFAHKWTDCQFTTVVSNMTLMDCMNLDSFLSAAAGLLSTNGSLIATITHPWFWPQYWGYADEPWFNYEKEIILEATFRISGEITDCVTTHVHRPLSCYLKSLSQAGFRVDRIFEPFPSEQVQTLYPERWKFPRFLAFLASKVPIREHLDEKVT